MKTKFELNRKTTPLSLCTNRTNTIYYPRIQVSGVTKEMVSFQSKKNKSLVYGDLEETVNRVEGVRVVKRVLHSRLEVSNKLYT